MNMRQDIKPALWGAAGGAVLLALVGFAWGGWQTAASARGKSDVNANTAVVGVLAPICAVQFRQQINADAKLTELKALKSYEQPGFIEKGGWATMPGSEGPLTGVASACATILTAEA
ncbi:MAG TPA: hypothetical protein VFK86_02770 [Bauldia sp.]|nr:hypothetical protein [Bauldia sp.]